MIVTIPDPTFFSRSERVARLSSEIEASFVRLRGALNKFSSPEEGGCLVCLQARDVMVDCGFMFNHFLNAHQGDDPAHLPLGEEASTCIARVKAYLKDSRKGELLFNYTPQSESKFSYFTLVPRFKGQDEVY